MSPGARLLAEEVCDLDRRYTAAIGGVNEEDDADSLLDDIRITAVDLAELLLREDKSE